MRPAQLRVRIFEDSRTCRKSTCGGMSRIAPRKTDVIPNRVIYRTTRLRIAPTLATCVSIRQNFLFSKGPSGASRSRPGILVACFPGRPAYGEG